MTEEITREYFNQRQEELQKKWQTKLSPFPYSHENALRFYRENQFEMFADIDELYNMAIILSIKGE